MTIPLIFASSPRTPKQVRDELCEYIADKHGVPLSDFYGSGRHKYLCNARWEAWERLHAMGYSTTRIGKIFNNRDHTTVSTALQKIKARRSLTQQELAA